MNLNNPYYLTCLHGNCTQEHAGQKNYRVLQDPKLITVNPLKFLSDLCYFCM